MATANFNILPSDGWVAITENPVDFIRTRSYPDDQIYYITSGSTAPAASDIGYRVDCKDFWVNIPTGTDIYYVRVVNPTPNQPNGLRIDVFFHEYTPV